MVTTRDRKPRFVDDIMIIILRINHPRSLLHAVLRCRNDSLNIIRSTIIKQAVK